ncbi:MAG TPA: signal peptidase I [Gemmatimonadales bacterium]
MSKRRRPWLAALLNLVVPGLGQLYAGYPVAAVVAYGLTTLAMAAWIGSSVLLPQNRTLFLLLAAGVAAVVLGLLIHAATLSAREPTASPLRPFSDLWYFGLSAHLTLGATVGTALWTRMRNSVEAFLVPTESMAPTLLNGDYVFVAKTATVRGRLTDGSIIVFESVEEPGLKVMKRVVGLPGDTLEMTDGALRRNGRLADEPFVIHGAPTRSEDPDQRAKMRRWQIAHTVAIDPGSYAPDLQHWGPLVVPPDSLFALGDNRDASYDSRYYGFIPLARVLGQPRLVYMSIERDTARAARRVRWSRVGVGVR